MGDRQNSLLIITSAYPYGTHTESYLKAEIEVLSSEFDRIFIFPLTAPETSQRALPINVEVVPILHENLPELSRKSKYIGFLSLLKVLKEERLQRGFISYFRINAMRFAGLFLAAYKQSILLEKWLQSNNTVPNNFYTYWMNNGALILSLLRERGKIPPFVCRVHGFDVYEDRHPENYLPFRPFILRQSGAVLSVSKAGALHLKSKQIFPEKVAVSYLGTADHGLSPFDKEGFTIMSCSNIVPVKRLHLLAEALRYLDFSAKWVHIGAGAGIKDIQKIINELGSNIEVKLQGAMPHDEVMSYFATNSVNVFINVSYSEGLPVSVMEAISFGVPVLATDAGGTSEIVNDRCGRLLPLDIEAEALSKEIAWFRTSDLNTQSFRAEVRQYWEQNFSAELNFKSFAELCKRVNKQ